MPRDAALPASSTALIDIATAVEVPRQRDERDARALVGRAVGERSGTLSGPARTSARPAPVTRNATSAGAAGRDVLRGGEDLDVRRREVDLDREAGDRPVVETDRSPEVVARPHLEGGVALAQPRAPLSTVTGNLHAPAERALLLGHRRRGSRPAPPAPRPAPRCRARASSTKVSGVFCPRNGGGVDVTWTPGTDCRQARYDTEPTTARSRIRTRRDLKRDPRGTRSMIAREIAAPSPSRQRRAPSLDAS